MDGENDRGEGDDREEDGDAGKTTGEGKRLRMLSKLKGNKKREDESGSFKSFKTNTALQHWCPFFYNVRGFFLHSLHNLFQSIIYYRQRTNLSYLRVKQEVRPPSFDLKSQKLLLVSWREGAEQESIRRARLETQFNAWHQDTEKNKRVMKCTCKHVFLFLLYCFGYMGAPLNHDFQP